jgi:glycosyltransferase involved in cell wall biosynthesis
MPADRHRSPVVGSVRALGMGREIRSRPELRSIGGELSLDGRPSVHDVAIVATARFDIAEPFAGGLEAHTHLLGAELHRRGHRVTVYAAGGDGPYDVRQMLPVSFEASADARRDVSTGPSDALAEHHSYLEAILELQHRGHDVVHINAVHHLPFACAGLLSPAVVTATLHTPPTPWLESALALAAARRLSPSLASVSHANAAAWRSVGADRVIHNGVDLDRWVPGAGGPVASWWGRLVPEKAPHLAIDAARVAGVPLTLMGPIHDREYFEAMVRPRLGGLVAYAGHLEVTELAAIVGRSAVAIVTPVWDEPFGLVIAEALAAGTPVAAFDSGAIGELVDDRTGRLARTGDVMALASAITAATALDRTACRARAEMCFSSTVMTDRYEAWFEELLTPADAA